MELKTDPTINDIVRNMSKECLIGCMAGAIHGIGSRCDVPPSVKELCASVYQKYQEFYGTPLKSTHLSSKEKTDKS